MLQEPVTYMNSILSLFLEGQSFFNPMLHFNFLVTISFSRRIDCYFQCMTVVKAHNRVSNLFLPR